MQALFFIEIFGIISFEGWVIMKHFVLFLVIFIIAIFSLQDLYMFSKTRTGQHYEYFKTITSQSIPPILANYLKNNNVRYSVYIMPNYVKDFLNHNKDFSVVYKSKPKFSVLIFSPDKKVKESSLNFMSFYSKVREQVNMYSDSFNLIVYGDNLKADYRLKYDKDAYKELLKYCGAFCLIDPSRDTIFVFNKISNSEKEALEALFQQYNFLVK